MFQIVGLGNIGKKFDNTPHNAGFDFVDAMKDFLGYDTLYSVDDWAPEKLAEASIAYARVGMNKRAVFVKPTTLMNASGRSVMKLARMLDTDISSELVIVHDDLDIKLGEYKIQKGIGPKGHNGIKSVELLLGRSDFLRIRMGVEGRVGDYKIPGEDYVLTKMKEEERVLLDETIADAVKSLRSLIQI